MSEEIMEHDAARCAFLAGQSLQYRNHRNYKGMPLDWTDIENGAPGGTFAPHYEFRIRPANYQQRLAAQSISAKLADRKSRPDLFPAKALLDAGDVLAFGETKHPGQPWKKMTVDEHMAAVYRHLLNWQQEGNDPETKLDHRAHALCRLAFALSIGDNK